MRRCCSFRARILSVRRVFADAHCIHSVLVRKRYTSFPEHMTSEVDLTAAAPAAQSTGEGGALLLKRGTYG